MVGIGCRREVQQKMDCNCHSLPMNQDQTQHDDCRVLFHHVQEQNLPPQNLPSSLELNSTDT